MGFTLVMVGYKGGFGDGDGDAGSRWRDIWCGEGCSLIACPDVLKAERKDRKESKKRRRDWKAEQEELMKVEVDDDE